ncbi:hypothetical protein OUZ56_013524 [Daphnia magna]|uniref:Fucosyltransferase n=1 Tax=Daphnia magna TaxID=35525 RepID=A0ABQ9Z648_9CRUS|nr:hypothetical protein OUZ56_013524 [Daphnia magna]
MVYMLRTRPHLGFGHQPFVQNACEVSDCVVFANRSSLPFEKYDAILIHLHELSKTYMPNIPRQKHQRFVFLTQESPNSMDTVDVTTMGHWFNWTMSYKLNSDIHFLYGHYVTEKFFEIMRQDLIPVVYGGANYSQFAPLHSYINALDYTPKELADYLKMLDANDMLYNEYFWWKDHYRVEAGIENRARHGFCDLCKKLHQDQDETKIYPELVSEWHPSTQCKRMTPWES